MQHGAVANEQFWYVEQSVQFAPPVPQAVSVRPALHVPPVSQQPPLHAMEQKEGAASLASVSSLVSPLPLPAASIPSAPLLEPDPLEPEPCPVEPLPELLPDAPPELLPEADAASLPLVLSDGGSERGLLAAPEHAAAVTRSAMEIQPVARMVTSSP